MQIADLVKRCKKQQTKHIQNLSRAKEMWLKVFTNIFQNIKKERKKEKKKKKKEFSIEQLKETNMLYAIQ